MTKIELNVQKELEPLLELKTSEGYIDLHNDYCVEKIIYENDLMEIYLSKSLPASDYTPRLKYQFLKLTFWNCKIHSGDINFLQHEKGHSFDNLMRSSSHTDKYYYVFSFIEGEEYEIECSEAFLEIT